MLNGKPVQDAAWCIKARSPAGISFTHTRNTGALHHNKSLMLWQFSIHCVSNQYEDWTAQASMILRQKAIQALDCWIFKAMVIFIFDLKKVVMKNWKMISFFIKTKYQHIHSTINEAVSLPRNPSQNLATLPILLIWHQETIKNCCTEENSGLNSTESKEKKKTMEPFIHLFVVSTLS